MVEWERNLRQCIESFLKELKMNVEIDDKIIEQTLPILLHECKKHIRPFIVHILGWDWYWWMEYWWQDYLKYKLNCEIGARGLGKSYFWSKAIAMYRDFTTRNDFGLLTGYNHDAGKELLRDVKWYYDNNELLNTRVPDEKRIWSTMDLEFVGKSRTKALGINSQLRGHHVGYVCLDDIKNDQQTMTDEQLKTKLLATVLPMIGRTKGLCCVVGTLFSQTDIYHFIKEVSEERDNWNFRRIWVELDDDEQAVYICTTEERRKDEYDIYDYEELKDLYYADPAYFMREYGCKITSSDTAIFDYEKHIKPALSGNIKFEEFGDALHPYVIGVDVAREKEGDYTAIVVMKMLLNSENNVMRMVHFERFKGVETEDQGNLINALAKRYNHAEVWVEKNNVGTAVIDKLTRLGCRVKDFKTTKYSKPDLIQNLQMWLFTKRILIPFAGMHESRTITPLIEELQSFQRLVNKQGHIELKGVGKHDDSVMSLAIAAWAGEQICGTMNVVRKKVDRAGMQKDRQKKKKGMEHIHFF